jgi:hypothetical protein
VNWTSAHFGDHAVLLTLRLAELDAQMGSYVLESIMKLRSHGHGRAPCVTRKGDVGYRTPFDGSASFTMTWYWPRICGAIHKELFQSGNVFPPSTLDLKPMTTALVEFG